jgi:hypothetical protein
VWCASSEGKGCFCSQKQQKSLINRGRADGNATGPNFVKVFTPLFSKSGRVLYRSRARRSRFTAYFENRLI